MILQHIHQLYSSETFDFHISRNSWHLLPVANLTFTYGNNCLLNSSSGLRRTRTAVYVETCITFTHRLQLRVCISTVRVKFGDSHAVAYMHSKHLLIKPTGRIYNNREKISDCSVHEPKSLEV